MVVVLRIVYVCAAVLSMAAGALVSASLFILDRAPQSTTFLGISLVLSAVFQRRFPGLRRGRRSPRGACPQGGPPA